MRILLLLSGGFDSYECLKMLKESGLDVHCLCIDGKQHKEAIKARINAHELNAPLTVKTIIWFDETTYNPVKLIIRDIRMLYEAKKLADSLKIRIFATGLKRSDFGLKLFWLFPFMAITLALAKLLRYKIICPVWNGGEYEITRKSSRRWSLYLNKIKAKINSYFRH